MVMVKKSTGKWRMCVDYINLHKACPKDAYTLPSIDKLVDTTCATYQRLMNKVFKEEIGENIKVYVDDMVVKYLSSDQHARDLAEIFAELRKLNMRLNPKRHFWGWGW
ncbi:uncharacterized protein LOC114384092 [Glycine soja]|uniref:uncharacterized protein LOC114384092 n=1 Tax=Glycine soja TaxID=3848 RepID=UPI001038A09F|nr:uncharacterized protein LOC114384092 [Glycine soja]